MRIFICVYLTILGAIIGSFLGCMGYRIPNKIKTTYPSSFCPNCKKKLKWYMNIPILSYILLEGKCKYCKKKIGSIYFIIEVLGAILFASNYLIFDFSISFFIATILTCLLLMIIVSDFEYFYISDRSLIIAYMALLIIIYNYDKSIILTRIVSSVIIFFVMYGIKILGNAMFKKESLGDGDIKLMAVIGLSLGLFNSFISLFFAAVSALTYSLIILRKNKTGIIPFGPFILIGSLIVIYILDIITPLFSNLMTI